MTELNSIEADNVDQQSMAAERDPDGGRSTTTLSRLTTGPQALRRPEMMATGGNAESMCK
ncbi:MAG: hypothetical protein Ct9H90mP1_3340 [Methanobacteriota archaeon]|nr:MAG: hypothetical protein Ct9H90mP1_3340 [Euryarchaeota archaeon]